MYSFLHLTALTKYIEPHIATDLPERSEYSCNQGSVCWFKLPRAFEAINKTQ